MKKLFLYFPLLPQLHFQIDHGGVDILMAEPVSDLGNRCPIAKHIHGAGMAETVNRIQHCQPFFRQRCLEIFSADPVNPVPGKLFTTLINKQPVITTKPRLPAVVFDVAFEQICCFGPQAHLPVPVALAEQSYCFVFMIKIIELQIGDLRGPESSSRLRMA